MKRLSLVMLGLLVVLSGCGRNMYDQARYETLEPSNLFEDGNSMRLPVENTIARGSRANDQAYYSGLGAGGFVSELPMPLTEELLMRGQERYNIYCSPCHNFSGNGEGMIVQRGFIQPASFHEQRLREQPLGYFVNAITNGFGRMYRYGYRIPAEDRWAIAAYIRSLQFSQYAPMDVVPEAQRRDLLDSLQTTSDVDQGATP